MNDESARNASRLRMNACVCSHALHGQFANTLLAKEKKVGYFLNRPRIAQLFLCMRVCLWVDVCVCVLTPPNLLDVQTLNFVRLINSPG